MKELRAFHRTPAPLPPHVYSASDPASEQDKLGGGDQLATPLREMQWGRVRECSVQRDEGRQRKGELRWGAGAACRGTEEKRSVEVRTRFLSISPFGFVDAPNSFLSL